MLSGLVLNPLVLLLYFLSAVVVLLAIERHVLGQFMASFLQASLSTILLICFGPQQPLIFLMLGSPIAAAACFWHWTDLIYSANR
ncbi:MAG TPA: hypothetical protein VGM54_22895 [Chthoniobacter sp.]